jgi:solute carrier family 8 (sodium/calcium exchanger)
MIIIGTCVMAIPDGGKRRIDRFYVYGITAAASLFAYLWLLFILKINTEGVIDLWEALVTLIYFPVLVIIAYLADRNMLCFQSKPIDGDKENQVMNYNPETIEGIELID